MILWQWWWWQWRYRHDSTWEGDHLNEPKQSDVESMIVLVPLWMQKTRINVIPYDDGEDNVDDDAKNKDRTGHQMNLTLFPQIVWDDDQPTPEIWSRVHEEHQILANLCWLVCWQKLWGTTTCENCCILVKAIGYWSLSKLLVNWSIVEAIVISHGESYWSFNRYTLKKSYGIIWEFFSQHGGGAS